MIIYCTIYNHINNENLMNIGRNVRDHDSVHPEAHEYHPTATGINLPGAHDSVEEALVNIGLVDQNHIGATLYWKDKEGREYSVSPSRVDWIRVGQLYRESEKYKSKDKGEVLPELDVGRRGIRHRLGAAVKGLLPRGKRED